MYKCFCTTWIHLFCMCEYIIGYTVFVSGDRQDRLKQFRGLQVQSQKPKMIHKYIFMAFIFCQSCMCFAATTTHVLIACPHCSVRKCFQALLHAPFYTPCLALAWQWGFTRLRLLSIRMRNINYFWNTSDSIHGCCWFMPALLRNQPRESKTLGHTWRLTLTLYF